MRSSLASSGTAWAAIVFVGPVALLAACLLVPNALELADRVRTSMGPQRPLALMLLAQVALAILPAATFVSWRYDRGGPSPWCRSLVTIALAGTTFGLGLFAYLWLAVQVAAFPP